MNSDDLPADQWVWHEYPIGISGEIARAFTRTLLPFLIGLGGAFALLLGVGLLAEQDVLDDPGLANAVDHLSRFSVEVLAVGAACAWTGYAVATYLREVTTSRAVLRAVANGADRRRVPSPEQVEAITREPGENLTFFAWGTGAFAVLAAVIGIGTAFSEGDKSGPLVVTFLCVAWAVTMFWFALRGSKLLTAAHERRQAQVAAHWRSDDESKAWRRAKQEKRRTRSPFIIRPAERLLYLATLVAAVGMVVFQTSLGVRCSAVPGSPGQRCEETHYSSPVEQALSWGFGLTALALAVAIVLVLAGLMLDWRQRSAEAAALRASLDDLTAHRPDDLLLAHHARRHTPPIARVAVVLSALGLLVGTSAYLVGRGQGLGSEDVYGAYQTQELSVIVLSAIVLVVSVAGTAAANIRGREFRNQLMQRWPAAPSWSSGEDGRVLRAKTGPALSGPRYKKVGKNKSGGS